VGSNPSRLAKIYREVSILRGVSHPNIVRLHEMTETERHIGIVLEYASGGELFDYILTHRYLKDNAARRLFAQLVSGVGYLHKKGIVHRDLKLENLLLDRNRNIIITDFGFANTFDPNDELTEEEELGLGDREFVKRVGLDKKKTNGMRKGDLMQTSCGSPCYAAPELVVSDSLYTGRKVDVWSCGVILYAMLAGYLPFDDDPANPEGDNINLLYKYIVNTPLTFPEYVTPHARDLLRRILVPSPRKRADLFEVARHSWLSEYAHVVELITSTTTTSNEIQNATVPSADEEPTGLARSASVREPSKAKQAPAVVGDLARKQGPVDPEEAAVYAKQQRDNKRRTVQVEYVAPTTQTQRGGEPSGYASQSQRSGKARARSSSRGPLEVQTSTEKPLPKEPYSTSPSHRARPPSTHQNPHSPAMRPDREGARPEAYTATGRPATGGSVHSNSSRHGFGANRASYGQPLPPTVAGTNVHGRMSQPGSGAKNYQSSPGSHETDLDFGRPSLAVPAKVSQISGFSNTPTQSSGDTKGHRRSNTVGEIGAKIFGRRGSIFGGRNKKRESQPPPEKNRKYPPVSMTNSIPGDSAGRPSMDSRASRRSFSQGLGLGSKRSGSMSGSQASQEKPPNPRRFSLMKAMGLSKDGGTPPPPEMSSLQHLPLQYGGQPDEHAVYADEPHDRVNAGHSTDGTYDEPHHSGVSPQQYQRYASGSRPSAIPTYLQQGGQEPMVDYRVPVTSQPSGYSSEERATSRNRGVLQKNKRFVDAYDGEDYGRSHDHAGSSGAAKRVMDFFRRRAKARGGEA
jgi:protein-serine/threonine kinase